jgi:hypothetical protein
MPSPPPPGVAAMPPPTAWERVAAPPPGPALPSWGTLVLRGAARGWMIFAIVWGSILFLTQNVTQNVIFGHTQSSIQQFSTAQNDTDRADSAIEAAGAKASSCQTVACVRPTHLAAAASLTQLADDLRGMSLPANANGEARDVENDASQLASIFTELADSSDGTTYRATAQRSDISSLLNSYSSDSTNLLHTLDSDL